MMTIIFNVHVQSSSTMTCLIDPVSQWIHILTVSQISGSLWYEGDDSQIQYVARFSVPSETKSWSSRQFVPLFFLPRGTQQLQRCTPARFFLQPQHDLLVVGKFVEPTINMSKSCPFLLFGS